MENVKNIEVTETLRGCVVTAERKINWPNGEPALECHSVTFENGFAREIVRIYYEDGKLQSEEAHDGESYADAPAWALRAARKVEKAID